MSIPLVCAKCGESIGVRDEMALMVHGMAGDFGGHVEVGCPGKGKHPPPKVTRAKRLFGLLERVTTEYPETYSSSTHEEYVGPRTRRHVIFAILFGTKRWPNGSHDGVFVDGKWVWFDWSRGLYGEGKGLLEA
jgi:hypothetical protein